MELPEINQKALDAVCSAQPIELAQLHCLRSIAVSLEVITVNHAKGSDENINTICSLVDRYTVRHYRKEVSGDVIPEGDGEEER